MMLVEQGVRVVEELARGGLAEDRRVFALQLPGEEEELPVDHLAQRGQVRLDGPDPGEGRDGEVAERDPLTVGAGLLQGQQGPPLGLLVLLPEVLLIGAVGGVQRRGPVVAEQVGNHADDAGRVEDVDGGAVVRGRDPHRGVLA